MASSFEELEELDLKQARELSPRERLGLLAEFARYEVRYALLGGYAVGIYAKPRATKDLDLLISGGGDNLERVAAALAARQRVVAIP